MSLPVGSTRCGAARRAAERRGLALPAAVHDELLQPRGGGGDVLVRRGGRPSAEQRRAALHALPRLRTRARRSADAPRSSAASTGTRACSTSFMRAEVCLQALSCVPLPRPAAGPAQLDVWLPTPVATAYRLEAFVSAEACEAALAAPPAGAALGGAGGAVAPALQQRPEEAVAMTATIAAKSLAETTAGTMTASTAEKSLAEMVGAPPANTWNIVATRASAGQNMNHITRLQNGMDRDLGSLEIWMSPFVNPCNGGCGLAAWCGVLLLLRLLLLLLCRPSAAVAALPLEAPVWPGGFLLRAVLLAAGGGGLRAAVPALAVSPSSVFVLGQSAGEATN
ncbi:unnamed protein product [Prorocentrum cordatum]|uniref:Uncharacterized protein n=1 Tax=Prorocentrum cordatum TaxID=2364126 RepID=A0ABN9RUS0_9DINO|nr:unnamed protein product [Polarella glacialis]